MNEYVLVETFGDLSDNEKNSLNDIGAAIGVSNSLIGGDAIIQILLVTITPIALKVVRDIVLARINSGQSIIFKTNNMELKNVDSETLLKVIREIERQAGTDDA